MRNQFRGYYPPTTEEFTALWSRGEIVLDTNVLLHIYRYGAAAREHLLGILDRLRARLWIPHQVGLEYHRRRADLVSQQIGAYDAIGKSLDGLQARLAADLDPYRSRHSHIDVSGAVEKPIAAAVARVRRHLERLRSTHPNLLREDPLRDRLGELLDGRIGAPPDDTSKQASDAEARLNAELPPGLRDKGRSNAGTGDAIIWLQLLEHAKDVRAPTILVTDDAKDDWWFVQSGQTIGPRPELIEEFYRIAEAPFYMYPSDRFIEEAERFLAVTPKPAVVEEVRELRKEDQSAILEAMLGIDRNALEQHMFAKQLSELAAWKSIVEHSARSAQTNRIQKLLSQEFATEIARMQSAQGLSPEALAAIRQSPIASQMSDAMHEAALQASAIQNVAAMNQAYRRAADTNREERRSRADDDESSA